MWFSPTSGYIQKEKGVKPNRFSKPMIDTRTAVEIIVYISILCCLIMVISQIFIYVWLAYTMRKLHWLEYKTRKWKNRLYFSLMIVSQLMYIFVRSFQIIFKFEVEEENSS